MFKNRVLTSIQHGGFWLWIACISTFSVSEALADEQQVLRIGTGGTGGTYLPIGSLISDSLSRRLNESLDGAGKSALIVLPQRSSGSVANVLDIGNGLLESGLAQADVAHWAYHGAGPFEQLGPITNVRTLATLYFESLHLVAHVDSGIDSVADLIGQRVSVDEVGSGTELHVRPILDAFEISNDELKMVFLKPSDSIDRLRNEKLDAFFIVAGYPVSGVSELLEDGVAKLVPIAGPIIDKLLEEHPFLTTDRIPASAYSNSTATPTLAVAAQWLISADVDDDIVYEITRLLWSESTQKALAEGHEQGSDMDISSALKGVGIPLHAGAYRFYEEIGMAVSELPY